MRYHASDHTFAICAYKESPYLEECILSLRHQTKHSRVIICTSTPNAYIRSLADKYHLKLYINPVSAGIGADWNFAVSCVRTPLVTLAHQDDIYEPGFLKNVLKGIGRDGDTLISFTDYFEIQDGRRVYARDFVNLRIKQLMLLPLRLKALQRSKFTRRRILSLGDPIGCPSVTYVLDNLQQPIFDETYGAALDWQTWERLSRLSGRFSYVAKPLMGHRMYAASTTVKMIKEGDGRSKEDLEIFRLFWPEPIARLICRIYAVSQKKRKALK